MPRVDAFVGAGRLASVGPVLPAVTCSVQSTYLTGTWPSEHGIVGNGWYDRDECEIKFWKQSSQLVQRPRVWDIAKTARSPASPAPTSAGGTRCTPRATTPSPPGRCTPRTAASCRTAGPIRRACAMSFKPSSGNFRSSSSGVRRRRSSQRSGSRMPRSASISDSIPRSRSSTCRTSITSSSATADRADEGSARARRRSSAN